MTANLLLLAKQSTVERISHIHRHVSAYSTNERAATDLEEAILAAYLRLREEGSGSELVDQDGDMSLLVTAAGTATLMIPWRRFDLAVETQEGTRMIREMDKDEVREHLASVTARMERTRKP